MDPGRVHAFVAANRAGHVVYERFYDRLSEAAKAEARAAMHAAAQQSPLVELQDYVGWHK